MTPLEAGLLAVSLVAALVAFGSMILLSRSSKQTAEFERAFEKFGEALVQLGIEQRERERLANKDHPR